jgi:uncharacterized protein YndB with AHSA1/START domain
MIGEADYWSLRWMMRRHLPDTRDEWLNRRDRLRSDWAALGHEVEYVDVSPAEFLEFCWGHDWQPDLFALDRYVWDRRQRPQATG